MKTWKSVTHLGIHFCLLRLDIVFLLEAKRREIVRSLRNPMAKKRWIILPWSGPQKGGWGHGFTSFCYSAVWRWAISHGFTFITTYNYDLCLFLSTQTIASLSDHREQRKGLLLRKSILHPKDNAEHRGTCAVSKDSSVKACCLKDLACV